MVVWAIWRLVVVSGTVVSGLVVGGTVVSGLDVEVGSGVLVVGGVVEVVVVAGSVVEVLVVVRPGQRGQESKAWLTFSHSLVFS